jgi:hypothetical protein
MVPEAMPKFCSGNNGISLDDTQCCKIGSSAPEAMPKFGHGGHDNTQCVQGLRLGFQRRRLCPKLIMRKTRTGKVDKVESLGSQRRRLCQNLFMGNRFETQVYMTVKVASQCQRICPKVFTRGSMCDVEGYTGVKNA